MRIKKLLCLMFAFAILFGTVHFASTTASAAELDEADLCLMDSIKLMVTDDIETLSYSRIELYNHELQHTGYGYETTINGKIGFALMTKRASNYEMMEFYPSGSFPFKSIKGLPVYITLMSYIEYLDGQYIDIREGFILDEERIMSLTEKGFGYSDDEYEGYEGGGSGVVVKETVSYSTKETDQGRIAGGVPSYFNTNSNLSGECAVQAGAVVVGYFARYYSELAPNFMVGIEVPPSYIYFTQNSIIQGIINDLYTKMETNVGGSGTTAAGFRNGLKYYVESKGRNISYTSLASGNTLNYYLYKTQVANLKPTVLFLNTYNYIKSPAVDKIDDYNDGIEMMKYTANHVMIGYGYQRILYYNASGTNFRTDTYLEVYTGNLTCPQGYIKLYDNSILVEAYAINVY